MPVRFFFLLRIDGKQIVVLRLDDRTLHVFAGDVLGLGRVIKARETSSCHSLFGLDAAG